ncbi:adenylyltransferase/cytidyltransferase family protein [Butyrivibrio sp. YAB3001]|uniref:adenylyltransferase/cytidyltransferase family protein n=1 Tax=Butyrivibrio sp. YAB3001 TaxID=1520812 RepID=UPI0008F65F4E|nr:adenylyltransferase/cytidyltransferase family protein [Butyrivibrio sp. YAB3001]SFC59577.1 cytidyltransferase-like domain-containing protein [Butyrivibrio sp. YAB3001]
MSETILQDIRTGILRWYPFKESASVLIVLNDWKDGFAQEVQDAISAWLLSERVKVDKSVVSDIVCEKDNDNKNSNNREHIVTCDGYDYILLIGIIEYCENPVRLLSICKTMLNKTGRLLLATDNRLGTRYFAGDHDFFTDRSFDGIDGYEKIFRRDKEMFGGRSYARFEVEEFLDKAGFKNKRFFSVFPDIRASQFIYAEDYEPNEDMSARYFPYYNNPESVFLNEGKLLNTLSKNGMLHKMANGYVIECVPDYGECCDICHATMSLDRGENDMITIIRKRGFELSDEDSVMAEYLDLNYTVEKKGVNDSGRKKIQDLLTNSSRLRARGIKVVPMKSREGCLLMPYVNAIGGMEYFKEQAYLGKEAFLSALDKFYELILDSSEEADVPADYIFDRDLVTQKPVKCKNAGKVLKLGYPDMVPLNTFVINGEFYFFDQEFVEETYPAKAVMYRVICLLDPYAKMAADGLTRDKLLDMYDMSEDGNQWRFFERKFCDGLLKQEILSDYRKGHTPENGVIVENLERVSFGAGGYKKVFVNVLDGCNERNVIVFGSGAFAKRFISLYKDRMNILFMVDNDVSRQETEIDGIEIKKPESLADMPSDSYKLIICIRQYVGILKQIKKYGVEEYGIFNPEADYNIPDYLTNKRKNENIMMRENNAENGQYNPKPYHTGYVAGVFDLFHVGHLNILKRAKDNCDYLIVGLVSDEGVKRNKGAYPVISFDDRKAILEGCRYVDEVVEIPLNAGDSLDAWRLNHFDVQFSGSDYEHDEYWLKMKSELEKHGATIVFFPYTESTSSTKLKEKLKK